MSQGNLAEIPLESLDSGSQLTPSLLFSIEAEQFVWGVGILESSNQEKHTVSVDLYPPHGHTDSALPLLPQATCEIRGKLLLGVEWQRKGAKLELHSIRSLVLPVSRFYELKRLRSSGEKNDAILWTLQIWALPPANAEAGIPVCKIEIEAKSIPFTEHKLKLERPVEIFWPEAWTGETTGETVDPVQSLMPNTVAMRCRHAMFEGATANGTTARSLKHWAELGSWFLFGPRYSRYDDELLPIDEVTALHPNGDFALTQSDLLELRQDESYMFCHSSVVRFVLLSWGWDIEAGELKLSTNDEMNGQGWIASGSHAWRLRHLCLSCWLLGQDDLRQTCNHFVMSLGDAPWTETGFSEALFTNEPRADTAEDFWKSRRQPSLELRIGRKDQHWKSLDHII